MRPSRIEVDLKNFEENIKIAKDGLGKSLLLTVVKADAYGHGAVAVSHTAIETGTDWLGVGIVEEGIQLRESGITAPILILSQELPERAGEIVRYKLAATVCDKNFLNTLDKEAYNQSKRVKVFIKIDTGMGRYGVLPEDFPSLYNAALERKNVEIIGVMSHFPSADTDIEFTERQLELLKNITQKFNSHLRVISIANSAGFLNLKSANLDMVRLGIVLYGISPIEGRDIPFKPVMKVKSKISFIKTIPPGYTVSYGRAYKAKKSVKVGVVPIGYADGYDRHLSNKGWMVVKSMRVPIIGNITMDATMVDLTAVPDVKTGDEITIMDEEITAWDLAKIIGTIPYEIVTRMGKRLPRVYI